MELLERDMTLADIDRPNGFGRLKARLVTPSGLSYRDFRRSLVPDFRRAKLDLALGYLYLAAVVAALAFASGRVAPIAVVLAGAAAFGFGIAYNQLFLHAAAHYELDGDRARNDRISNAFVGIISGQEIRTYRTNHFLHHNVHGTVDDPENSYFNALTLGFIVRLLTGLHVVRIIVQRQRTARGAKATGTGGTQIRQLLAAVVFQIVALAGMALLSPWVALAWVAGIAIVFPFPIARAPGFGGLGRCELLRSRARSGQSDLQRFALRSAVRRRRIFASCAASLGFGHRLHQSAGIRSVSAANDVGRSP
jgi:fatty acid desaturase